MMVTIYTADDDNDDDDDNDEHNDDYNVDDNYDVITDRCESREAHLAASHFSSYACHCVLWKKRS